MAGLIQQIKSAFSSRAVENIECFVGDELIVDISLDSPVGLIGYGFDFSLSAGLQYINHTFQDAFEDKDTLPIYNSVGTHWYAGETLRNQVNDFSAQPFKASVLHVRCRAILPLTGFAYLTNAKIYSLKSLAMAEIPNEIEYNNVIILTLPDQELVRVTVKFRKVF